MSDINKLINSISPGNLAKKFKEENFKEGDFVKFCINKEWFPNESAYGIVQKVHETGIEVLVIMSTYRHLKVGRVVYWDIRFITHDLVGIENIKEKEINKNSAE